MFDRSIIGFALEKERWCMIVDSRKSNAHACESSKRHMMICKVHMANLVWMKSKAVETSQVFIGISEKQGVKDGEGEAQAATRQLSRQGDAAEAGKRQLKWQSEAEYAAEGI